MDTSDPSGEPSDELSGHQPIPAGDFAAWLSDMEAALAGEAGADVPCGPCTACCASSQFVHIGPEEAGALAAIPAELLFPAPGMPAGHVLMGYDERGRCPMLGDGGCTIYDDRPRTCRTYDCRVFPAAGLDPDPDKPRIAERTRRWRFAHPDPADAVLHDAVRAAATFVRTHRDALPEPVVPHTATQHAVLAVRLHGAFVSPDGTGGATLVDPDPAEVLVHLEARRAADS